MKTGKKLLTIAVCLFITLSVGFAVAFGVDYLKTLYAKTAYDESSYCPGCRPPEPEPPSVQIVDPPQLKGNCPGSGCPDDGMFWI